MFDHDLAMTTGTMTTSAADRAGQLAETRIDPERSWRFLDFGELWKYRELLYLLVWRDIKVRYKQTVLGAGWALFQPVMMMIVFTLFFGRVVRLDADGVPYSLFVYSGLLPWTFFATAISFAANSVVSAERVITKIYFPRILIPFATVGAALVDFAIAALGLAVMMLWYGVPLGPHLAYLPLITLLFVLAALGIGTLLSALNVMFRDFRYVIPFLVQLWMFATPTIYMQPHSTTEVAAASDDVVELLASYLLCANPMTGLVAAFRAIVVGQSLPWGQLAIAAPMIVGMFIIGCAYFRRVEDTFADVI
jgi:lipopolysaccharide transport system permease protein